MSVAEQIMAFTSAKIHQMLENPSESAVRASMARLRRGIGHVPGEIPELWGEFLLDMPDTLMGQGEISRAEWAIYIAMTMFALHQQSSDRKTKPMHKQGDSLGAAANKLIENEDDRERVARRFYPVATASDMEALSHHLRSLVTILRSKDIPLDYVRLATDLYSFQNSFQNPTTVDGVRLCWGEDFCRIVKNNDENMEEEGQ